MSDGEWMSGDGRAEVDGEDRVLVDGVREMDELRA